MIRPESLAESKRTLRATMRRRRAAVTSHEQILGGLSLKRRLDSLLFLRGGILLGSLSHRGEIDARPFLQSWIERGYPLALPRVDPAIDRLEIRRINMLDTVILGFRGIPEPDPETADLLPPTDLRTVLVPGLAFDLTGNRVGQGGGHYDRLLSTLEPGCVRIGIAHDFQILTRVPADPEQDQPMDLVVSPIRVIQCRPGRGALAPG
jgi:5-formyltetrahydrofolate cyclo-ligase